MSGTADSRAPGEAGQVDLMELSGANYAARMEGGVLVPVGGTPVEATRRAALKIAFLRTDYVRYDDGGITRQVAFSEARLEFTEARVNAFIDAKYAYREEVIERIIDNVVQQREGNDDEIDDAEMDQAENLDDLVRVQDEIHREIAFGRHIFGQDFRQPPPASEEDEFGLHID